MAILVMLETIHRPPSPPPTGGGVKPAYYPAACRRRAWRMPIFFTPSLYTVLRPLTTDPPTMQTIHAAAAAIRQRDITPVDLVEQCLAAIDRWEEKIRAWVFVDR